MTSPLDASLTPDKGPDDAVQAPASLGWISAHAIMAGGASASAWRDPLALARSAAAAMAGGAGAVEGAGGLSVESRDGGSGAAEFAKPFRAASEAVGLIRNPLRPLPAKPPNGSGAWAEAFLADPGPGPADSTLSDGPAAGLGDLSDLRDLRDLHDLGPLGVAGAFATSAPNGIGDPFRSTSRQPASGLKAAASPSRHRGPDGSWVETGNPTTRNGLSAYPRGRSAHSAHSGRSTPFPGSIRSGSGPQSVPAAGERKRSPDSKSAVKESGAAGSSRATSAAAGAAPSLPPAQTELGHWAERVARNLARFASGTASGPERNTVSVSGNAASPKRIPPILPDDAETFARFKMLMEAQARLVRMSGSPAMSGNGMDSGPDAQRAQGAPDASAREAAPVIHPRVRESGSDGMAAASPIDLTGLADELCAPFRPAAGLPGQNTLDALQARSSTRDPNPDAGPHSRSDDLHRIAPRPPASLKPAPTVESMPAIGGGGVIGSGNGASVQRHGPSQVEWMDEEDDLASKLHRLLRRQAKRRGVELP